MPTVSEEIVIAAPRERVWDFICDPTRYPEWIYFVNDVFDISENPLRGGSVYHERAKPGPLESESRWVVTEFEPPKLQVHVGEMPEMEAELRMRLEEVDGGTRWHHEMDFRMLPKLRPLGWILERMVVRRKMQSDFRRILASAKEILEGEGHGS